MSGDKTIISVFVVILIVAGFWYFFFKGGGSLGAEETFAGEITAIDLSQTKFDGPVLVTVKTSSGQEKAVEIRTKGMILCPSYAGIADAFWLNIGEKVEVKGEANTDGVVVPCASESHYFRVTEEKNRYQPVKPSNR